MDNCNPPYAEVLFFEHGKHGNNGSEYGEGAVPPMFTFVSNQLVCCKLLHASMF